ncbi:MAG: hypothetical protein GYA33_08205 [Thermogutta sp.]|nr:hypothetical protein [Thermogutta sp.]
MRSRASFRWMAVAVLLGAWTAAVPSVAEEPMGIVRFASLDEWDRIMDGIEELSGDSAVAKALGPARIALAMARGSGIDDSRPWGLACLPVGDGAGLVLVVPVKDVDRLHETAKPAIEELEELEGGGYRVKMGGRNLFCAVGGGWISVSEKAEALKQVPDDPTPWLDAPEGAGCVAARANLAAVPREQADKVRNRLRKQARKALHQQPGESDAVFELRKAAAKRMETALWEVLRQTETLDFAVNWDRQAGKVLLTSVWKAQEGTELADWFRKQEELVSPLPLLRSYPGTLCYLGWNYLFPGPSHAELDAAGRVIRDQLHAQLERRLPDPTEAEFAKGMVDDFLRLLGEAAESGRSEGAAAALSRKDELYLIAAGRVPDPLQVEQLAGKIVEAIQAKVPQAVVSVQPDAFADEDFKIHLLTVNLPEEAAKNPGVQRMFGSTLNLAMLASEEYVAVILGKDAGPVLRDFVEEAESLDPQVSPAVEMRLNIEKAVAFASQFAPEHQKEKLSAVLDLFSKTADEEQIRVTVTCRGSEVRKTVEIDQAVFQIPRATR